MNANGGSRSSSRSRLDLFHDHSKLQLNGTLRRPLSEADERERRIALFFAESAESVSRSL